MDWYVANVGDAASFSILKTIKTLDQFNICIFLLNTYKKVTTLPQTNDEELCTQNRREGAVYLIDHDFQRDSHNGKREKGRNIKQKEGSPESRPNTKRGNNRETESEQKATLSYSMPTHQASRPSAVLRKHLVRQ